jgi:ABC-2 type transport system ATP-binding protein
MSIEVHHLSKRFHHQLVVDQLNFRIGQGQIVGLLGPNGAGKSTTMRMLTGYLAPSEGAVYIGGYDLQKDTSHAKRQIGYLPEHNPLYLDMYVHEYLHLMGTVHGLARQKSIARAHEVVEQCGIGDMQHKKLGALSKGYRQRVGLAQALLHNPSVLILDEPTTGLDPNQIHHMRAVIKELSREKAILLSTHMMQEVTAICDQVMILYQGKLRLFAPLDELTQQGSLEDVFTQLTQAT